MLGTSVSSSDMGSGGCQSWGLWNPASVPARIPPRFLLSPSVHAAAHLPSTPRTGTGTGGGGGFQDHHWAWAVSTRLEVRASRDRTWIRSILSGEGLGNHQGAVLSLPIPQAILNQEPPTHPWEYQRVLAPPLPA